MKVYFSELAESKLIDLTEYLLEEWSLKVRNDFVDKLSAKIKQITVQPKSCPESKFSRGLYKCVLTIQTTFFDTRQNPNKINKEI